MALNDTLGLSLLLPLLLSDRIASLAVGNGAKPTRVALHDLLGASQMSGEEKRKHCYNLSERCHLSTPSVGPKAITTKAA